MRAHAQRVLQRLALVRALKTHGKELADRWDRVAGEVEGKSRAECVRRFKALKEGLKAKKAGGEGEGA